MHEYFAFGWVISSEIKLALPSARRGSEGSGRLCIRFGQVAKREILPILVGQIRYAHGSGWMHLDAPWLARFQVRSGASPDSEIEIDPSPDFSERMAGLYITGLLLPMMLLDSGVVTLHGSAIRYGGRGYAFVGERGSGKSTVAAMLTASGGEVMCDDIIPVAGEASLLPGIPTIKLLPDAYSQLVDDPAAAADAFDGVDKYYSSFLWHDRATTLDTVFILCEGRESGIVFHELKGVSKVRALHSHLFTVGDFISPSRQLAGLLRNLAAVRVVELGRPDLRGNPEALRDAIIGYIGKEGASNV